MKLKGSLMASILDNYPTPNKYSRAYLNLRNVFDLESNSGFKFEKHMVESMKKIENKYNKFLNGIPLVVIERYYIDHKENYNKYIFLEYGELELSDIRIMDLFTELEKFYSMIFELTCKIADYYNLEVKLNSKGNNESEKYI